ncbi:unnamed protein product [Moneuplotes crassus]|uniref:Uncharacterized protein n=1 Tax=Euplotes crassus TaxID=5936 RepID=A0AAD1XVH7_EUPCR|nr:unnamed protein product [Moneuplotes crassus]
MILCHDNIFNQSSSSKYCFFSHRKTIAPSLILISSMNYFWLRLKKTCGSRSFVSNFQNLTRFGVLPVYKAIWI